MELRIENLEQYSRRTSLRFHNIRVPLNNMGRIKHPIDTDSIILDICKNNLSITDMKKEDIGRSHVIGKPKDGKSQVIVRFLSYRVREKVYNSKKELKPHPDNFFITENLYRTNLVKALAELKYHHLHIPSILKKIQAQPIYNSIIIFETVIAYSLAPPTNTNPNHNSSNINFDTANLITPKLVTCLYRIAYGSPPPPLCFMF